MELIVDYLDNAKYREGFNRLLEKTFKISLEKWFQMKFGIEDFICYSLLNNNNNIVANVSVSKRKLLINNKLKDAAQIGAVMTDLHCQKKGLAKELMLKVFDDFENKVDLIYLFANDTVLDFYPKFGFKRVTHRYLYTNDIIKKCKMYNFRKLDVNNRDDLQIIKNHILNRKIISHKFSVIDAFGINLYYCIYDFTFKNIIYFDEKNKVIVIYKYNNKILNLLDIIYLDSINIKQLLGSIINDDTCEVKFYFTIEFEGLTIRSKIIEDDNDALFIKGDIDIDGIVYPTTAIS